MATLDLGDTTELLFTTTSPQGTPTNPTTVVLTITLPDGSVVTPTVTNPPAQVGSFIYDYVTTQAGRHQVHWLATGSVNLAFNDVFDVRPNGAGMIFGLADAKESIRAVAGATANDDKLRDYIAAVTAVIESLYGVVVQRSFTEQRMGGTDTVSLSNQPVVSINSVTEYIGGLSYALTQASTPSNSSAFGFTFDARTGSITRRNAAGLRIIFIDEVWVTYVAGLSVIPDNVLLAARELLRFWWQNGQEGRTNSRTATQEDTVVVLGYAIPNRVREMLGATYHAPGFA